MDTRSRNRERREVLLKLPLPRLFLVTNAAVVGDPGFADRAAAALAAGGNRLALQLRAHEIAGRELLRLAQQLKAVCAETGSQLWINDRVDLAVVSRAQGVQLGTRSLSPGVARRLLGEDCRIGYSVHSVGEAVARLGEGADVALLGSVYASASHPGRRPLGASAVREAAAGGRPIVAIGGISANRVLSLIEAGAWGIAVLSGVWGSSDQAAEVRRYLDALEAALPVNELRRR
ncbi:MAG: thiamine phosphate synthase [Gemmatimonadota bacterium]|nr:MAG: thiamine phosphate synthase [Gemmatimonadota bacterium]